ncbi:3-phosphoserine/phosphohydroxythreonine transaminase [Candidatus Saccharibacteria bacterium]|nr:3-phosphoserine/phosphohydroxythreonine transaminase [Candidatus Saccharibacteria bacterium]
MRIYNFSAGPATLPEEVLKQASDEMLDWQGHGMSVMEMSHRSPEFISIAAEAEADLRELMSIPLNYKILFLQGGATGQFAAIPLNISKKSDRADYAITGMWSKKAHQEASKYLENPNIAIKTDAHTHVPNIEDWDLSEDSAYIHITPNETIHGVAFNEVPEIGNVPVAGDISSMILSQPIDVSKYGVLYAGAQKNIGPAGITIVIVREDLLGHARADTPTIWHWQDKAESGSMLNTPPTYSWYLAGLVFKRLKEIGGVEAVHKINLKKAKKLYDAIDSSSFYSNPVEPEFRSIMNVVFTLAKPELDKTFVEEAAKNGLKNLEGHRSVGGMRASIYNAMPEAGVEALIKFMKEFEKKHG